MMRPIRLEPEKHPAPVCEAFTDEQAIRRYEREVRVHRAFTEPFEILPLEARVDGAYRVASASKVEYLVDIVDGSAEHDTCTCPDFLSNELGTCKHMEAVRRAVAARRGLRAAFRRLAYEPAEPVLTVVAKLVLRLFWVGPWSAEARARLARSARMHRDGAGFEPGRNDDGLRVTHAVAPAVAKIEARRQQARWQRNIEGSIAEGNVDVDVLRRPLFPYQREGVLHLVRRGRAILADDMGLGKTVQAIAACEVLRRRGQAARVLIVTTASIKHQWAQEIERLTGERAAVVGGGAAERREALASGATYVILSYELTLRELSTLRDLSACVLILDEAQRAKNFRTRTSATLRAIPSRFLFVLTGTPIENRLDDLYALLQLVDPAILGPLWRFNLDFHEQNERGRITGVKNLSALRAKVAPVVLRRRKEEVLQDLPPRIEQTRYTAMTPEQIDLEAGYRMDAGKLLSIADRRPLRLEEHQRLMMLLLKARQACNALELCVPTSPKKASPKLDELEALVSELTEGEGGKILIFSEWVEMLKLAAERLEGLGVGYAMLHGGIATEKRPALLERFRDDASVRVLLSTDAGGVGLNLQVATSVIHLDLPWNPARLDQRTARAHRLGQTRGVLVTYLCAEQGIERGIEGTLARKRDLRAGALDLGSTEESIAAPSFSAFLREMREVLEPGGGETAEVFAGAGEEGEEGLAEVALGEEPLAAGEVAVSANAASGSLLVLPEAARMSAASESGERERAEQALPAPESGAPASGVDGDERFVREAELTDDEAGARALEAPVSVLAPVSAGTAEMSEAPARRRLRLARLVLDAGFYGDALRAAYEALAAAIGALGGGRVPEGHAALVALIYRELLPSGVLPEPAHAALARLHDLTTLERSGVPLDGGLVKRAVEEAEGWVGRLSRPEVAAAG